MESWRFAWRKGFVPQFNRRHLEAIRDVLPSKSSALLQGATVSPPPLECVRDWPVEAACVVGYCGWKGEGLETVSEVEEFFARSCFEADQRLGEPAGCRWFLNTYDEWTRDEMLREMLPEIELALANLPEE